MRVLGEIYGWVVLILRACRGDFVRRDPHE